ncbi:PEP-CTERM sorting domain-containing protein [Gemmatimonas phototrophica]|nr:PEP-CTERM sorting domain-containing protein [Gemmatimonas phototrophica]
MAQSVSYSQGEFVAAQWSFTQITKTPFTTGTELLEDTGGNLGSNWFHSSTLAQASGTNRYRVANINSTFTYDPRVNGALASLSFSYDLLGLSTAGYSEPFFGNYVPTLRQDGLFFFLSNGTLRPTTSWATYSITSAGVTNWVDPNNQSGLLRPDFSVNGTTMEFGYIMSGGGDCPFVGQVCSAASFSSRLDNFSVTANAVSTVPEPSTYALMAAGLGVLMLVQRRRRQRA